MRLVYLKKSVKNRDKYGRTEIAIQKTIEECLESEILVDFIKEHKEEKDEIMRNMSHEEDKAPKKISWVLFTYV